VSRIIGVDPGVGGGIALMVDGVIEGVIDMPVGDDEVSGVLLSAHIELAEPNVVVIEKVHSMPKQGVASSFNFGKSYGTVIGLVSALRYPLVKMTPQEWKRANGLIGKDKDASRQLAMELWPQHADHFKRRRDDGRAEAALIARAYHIATIRGMNGD
jgi:Holliday junction resolvasome RuvABC endonuclease subunit